MCDYCPRDGGPCIVCGGSDRQTPRRKYATRVAAVCVGLLFVAVLVSIACSVMNQLAR